MSSAELLAWLNETSREWVILRANNAKLRAERSRTVTPRVETTVKPEADDERLSAGVRSFGQLKQELAGFLDEAERFSGEEFGVERAGRGTRGPGARGASPAGAVEGRGDEPTRSAGTG